MLKIYKYGNSYLEHINGVDYLYLREENHYQTGFTAGILFTQSRARIIPFLKNPFTKIFFKTLSLTYKRRLHRIELPKDYRDELQGCSDATKIPYGSLRLLSLIYEVWGCSTFAFFNPDGSLIISHNTDLPAIVGKFILRYSQPLVTNVTIPGKNNFVHISYPLFVGVTNGFNEKGISINSHDIKEVFAKIVEKNLSTSAFSRMILEKSENLEDVLKIAKNNSTYLPVNFLVASEKERKFLHLEMHPSDYHFTVSSNHSTVHITNHFLSEKMKHYHSGIPKSSAKRLKSMEEILSMKKSLTVEEAIDTLKDKRNGLKREGTGKSLTNVGTFQSFVFDVTKREVHISNGRKLPVTLNGKFIKISAPL